MKEWIKLERCLVSEPKVREMMKKESWRGYGIYVFLRQMVESMPHEQIEKALLLGILKSMSCPLREALPILNNFGLFETTSDGIVTLASRTCAPLCAPLRSTSLPLELEESETPTQGEDGQDAAQEDRRTEEQAELEAWLRRRYPTLRRFARPLTAQEFQKLRERCQDDALLRDKMDRLENRANATKMYRSAYLTLLNWIRRDRAGEN